MTRPTNPSTKLSFVLPALAVAGLMFGAIGAQAKSPERSKRGDRANWTQSQTVKKHRNKSDLKRARAEAMNQRRAVMQKNKRRGNKFVVQRRRGRSVATRSVNHARRHQHQNRYRGKAVTCRRGFVAYRGQCLMPTNGKRVGHKNKRGKRHGMQASNRQSRRGQDGDRRQNERQYERQNERQNKRGRS